MKSISIKWSLLVVALTLAGCGMPALRETNVAMREREARSDAWCEARRCEAESMTPAAKARYFEKWLQETMDASGVWLAPHTKDAPGLRDLEDSSLWLATLAYRYRATGEAQTLKAMRRVVEDLERMDGANGLDGYYPPCVKVEGKGEIEASRSTSHFNAYCHLLYAFTQVVRATDDEAIRARIAAQVGRITRRVLDGGDILTTDEDEPAPHSDLRVRRFQLARSRNLDLLLLLEACARLVPETNDPALQSMVRARLDERAARGVYRRIQSLTLRVGRRHWPSCSSSWLNAIKLATLLSLRDDPAYRSALAHHRTALAGQRNPYLTLLFGDAAGMRPDEKAAALTRAEAALRSFPLTLQKREVLNRHRGDVELAPRRRIKNEPVVETKTPLPLWRRPIKANVWKFNQLLIEGNLGREAGPKFPGTDYLLLYWMKAAMEKEGKYGE